MPSWHQRRSPSRSVAPRSPSRWSKPSHAQRLAAVPPSCSRICRPRSDYSIEKVRSTWCGCASTVSGPDCSRSSTRSCPGSRPQCRVTHDPTIDDHRVVATRQWNPASRFADAMAFTLGALAMLSLLMAALVAAQASYSNMARRRLEQDRLVAIGVSRQALRTLGVAEGVVLGIAGTTIGLALGALVAERLLATAFGGDVTISTVAVARGPRPSRVGWLPRPSGPSWQPGCRAAVAGHCTVVGGLGIAVAVFGIVDARLLSAFAALAGLCAVQMAYVVPLFGTAARRLAALNPHHRSPGKPPGGRRPRRRTPPSPRRAVRRRRRCHRHGAHG